MGADLLHELREVVGERHVLVGELTAGFERDWTGRFGTTATAVVRPADTAQVAAVVNVCRTYGQSLVAQGGNTGLVGGSVPHGGEIVLSIRRLDQIGPVDVDTGQVTVGAGATLGALLERLHATAWSFGIDLAARNEATLGGMIATNAGGNHVVRHGTMRRQLLGVEAVLGTGDVISHLGGLEKDNTGYDLAGLLCGSEGTLAVITAARLRLVPASRDPVTAVVAVDDMEAAVAVAGSLRRRLVVDAIEVVRDDGVELAVDALGLRRPFSRTWPVLVLVEASGAAVGDQLADVLGDVSVVREVAVATDRARREELWAVREHHSEAIATLGPVLKLDVTVPLGQVAGFVDGLDELIHDVDPGARIWVFGHLGDGNMHVNLTGVAEESVVTLTSTVLTDVVSRGGSISAEHGIGVAKAPWLHLARTPAELDAFAAIRRALDPDAILNPAVLVPPSS